MAGWLLALALLAVKPGVELDCLRPQMAVAVVAIEATLADLGYATTITGACEDVPGRSLLSRHRNGLALDIRSSRIPNAKRPRAAEAIARALGDEFDVVLEPTHIHVEWDPPS